MSAFGKTYNRFTDTNADNITYRRKLSAVSSKINGGDQNSFPSPRNCYRNGKTKIDDEQKTEVRYAPIDNQPSSSTQIPKKPRTSTSSLASVFKSGTSSPIERMRKFIGRSSSKSGSKQSASDTPLVKNTDLNEDSSDLVQELEVMRLELKNLKTSLRESEARSRKPSTSNCSQHCEVLKRDIATMTDPDLTLKVDKENVNPFRVDSPEIICLNDVQESCKIRKLEEELAALKEVNETQKEDFRKTRKDFILILKEAVKRKDEVELKMESMSKNPSDEDGWISLMSQHRHTLRRNVLLLWVQKKIEPYSSELTVNNFSSDWSDCRAFCALLHDLFPETVPDVKTSPLDGDCISRCRKAFKHLALPFEEISLGISIANSSDNGNFTAHDAERVVDWRYIMDTVFSLYKRSTQGEF